MSSIINFEEVRKFRVRNNIQLWERLTGHCIQIIEECNGEVLPCIEEEENLILSELRRRNTAESLEVVCAYNTLRLITIKQLTNQYKVITNVSNY